ncbi:hypothetical protein REPUB_Repub06bG0048400 [Reevesia pubescens]
MVITSAIMVFSPQMKYGVIIATSKLLVRLTFVKGPRYDCRIGKFNLDLGCASSVVSQPPLEEDDFGFQELDR